MTHSRTALLAALLAAALAAPSALAQPSPRANRPDNAQPEPKVFAPGKQSGTVTLKFPGGTVRDYVEMVRKNAVDVVVNVSFTDSVDQLEMPAIEFTGVFVGTALDAVSKMVAPHAEQFVHVNQLRGGSGITGETLYILGLESNGPGATPPRKMIVLSLNNLIGSPWAPRGSEEGAIPAATILTAIETAARAAPGDGVAPDIRYHKESGMLLVQGTRNQLEVVQQVFSHFQDDVSSRHVDTVTVLKPESIPLAHAPAPIVIDALRAVYPAEPAATNAAKFSVDPKTNAVVVSGTAAQVCGVKAIIAFLDRQSSPLSNTEQLKGEAAKAQDEARMMSREMARYESAVESLRREVDQRSAMTKKLEDEARMWRERTQELEMAVNRYKEQSNKGEGKTAPPK